MTIRKGISNTAKASFSTLNDTDFSVSPLEDDSILFKSGKWKPQKPSSFKANNTYYVELSRWGISDGIPTKPWVDGHYILADNNIKGINNAIQWAYSNGYNYIIMPLGEYALCYPREIIIDKDYITLDLNGSTFKVLYNSDSKSPFDSRVDTDYYKFQGKSFVFDGAKGSSIVNGKIYGERLERSFVNPGEVAAEWTCGIYYRKGASFCTSRWNEIAYYMGDSIATESSGFAEYVEFGMTLTVNDISKATGELITSTNTTLASSLLTLPASTKPYNSFVITGQGYTRQTGILTKDVGVYYYRSDNSFISSIHNQKVYAPMTIPEGAAKWRFVFYNETDTTKTSSSLALHLRFGLTPHNNLAEYNEIYGNHRGGIQPGGSENVFQNNIIHDIGTAVINGLDIYGKPIFNDPTRYAINQEDSYGDSITIRDNLIYNCFAGILCGCYNSVIENNRIYNASNIGINIYTTFKSDITNNFLWKCGTTIGFMTSHFANAHVVVSKNTMVGGNSNFGSGIGYQVIVENNWFVDPLNISTSDDELYVFKNNHFKINSYNNTAPVLNINKIHGCTFEGKGTGQKTISIKAYEISDCAFVNVWVKFGTKNQTTIQENVTVSNSTFNNCKYDNHVDQLIKERKVINKNSKFNDTLIKNGNINSQGQRSISQFIECEFKVSTLTSLFQTQFNSKSGSAELYKCNVDISNSDFISLIDHLSTIIPPCYTLALKDCVVTYSGTGILALSYYPMDKRPMISFISSRTKFNNITLPAEDVGVFIGYDPDTQGLTKPTSGNWFAGQVYQVMPPLSGGYFGWVCITPGSASNTPWQAWTEKTIGDTIYNGTRAYQAITNGKTTGSMPMFPTTPNGTVIDNVGTFSKWNPSQSYTVGSYIVPNVSNGFYFECIVAGTSSSTEPTWSQVNNKNTTDNQVTWVARSFITWKEIGVLATFNPYGLIQ